MIKSAVITAGGTIESIDDVRFMEMHEIECNGVDAVQRKIDITNFSKGGLGKELAAKLVLRGVKTTLIIRKDLVGNLEESELLKIVTFKSVSDLEGIIRFTLWTQTPDLFLMAAAVSDYSPVKIEGKMSSNSDELTIVLRKNPKLIDRLRELAGKKAKLVGFKLLSGVSKEVLIETAKKQNKRADLDFTVANDFQLINPETGLHPVELVSKDGRSVSFEGSRSETADFLVNSLAQ